MMLPETLFDRAKACLDACEPSAKVAASHAAAAAWREGYLALYADAGPAGMTAPGRPERPALVAPREVPRRGVGTVDGRAALLHALAHIEFNAVNLAWDAIYRFRDMPPAYYDDWVRVADEEARHFTLLRQRLHALCHDYGDFPAHNGLWASAEQTANDPLLRMALVPRVLEARGLDVTPGMIERLRQVGDTDSVRVLEVIVAEEKGHVAIGGRWFRYLCRARNLEPRATFRRLLEEHMNGRIQGPFDEEARYEAGFTADELADLKMMGEAS